MMPSIQDEPKARKVIDVTEPGKSEPSASGRPIIVSNRPLLKQDPMVVPDESTQKEPLKNPSAVSIKIEPPDSESDLKVVTTAPSVPKKAVAKANNKKIETKDTFAGETIPVAVVKPAVPDDQPEEVAATESVTEPEKKDEPAKEEAPVEEVPPKADSETAESDDSEKQSEMDKEESEPSKVTDEAKQKEEAAKLAKELDLEKIIDSKKYFLPINSVEHRKDTRKAIGVLVIVLLVALVWLDLILDAGLIKINGIHAVTHFFSS